MKKRWYIAIVVALILLACALVPIDSYVQEPYTETERSNCYTVDGHSPGMKRLHLIKGETLSQIKQDDANDKFFGCFPPTSYKLYIL